MLDTTKNKPIVFEDNKPFSKCALWDLQRDFFLREGVNAWDHQVPFYITSNLSIANSTAQILLRFMQDWCHSRAYHVGEPFYILELGGRLRPLWFLYIKTLA